MRQPTDSRTAKAGLLPLDGEFVHLVVLLDRVQRVTQREREQQQLRVHRLKRHGLALVHGVHQHLPVLARHRQLLTAARHADAVLQAGERPESAGFVGAEGVHARHRRHHHPPG